MTGARFLIATDGSSPQSMLGCKPVIASSTAFQKWRLEALSGTSLVDIGVTIALNYFCTARGTCLDRVFASVPLVAGAGGAGGNTCAVYDFLADASSIRNCKVTFYNSASLIDPNNLFALL